MGSSSHGRLSPCPGQANVCAEEFANREDGYAITGENAADSVSIDTPRTSSDAYSRRASHIGWCAVGESNIRREPPMSTLDILIEFDDKVHVPVG